MNGPLQGARSGLGRPLMIGGLVAIVAAVVLGGYAATILIPSISRAAEIRGRLVEVSSELQARAEAKERAEANVSGSRMTSAIVRRLAARRAHPGMTEEQVWQAQHEERRKEAALRKEMELLTREREQVADRTREGVRFGVIGLIALVPGVVLLVTGFIARAVGRTARPEATLEVEEFVPN